MYINFFHYIALDTNHKNISSFGAFKTMQNILSNLIITLFMNLYNQVYRNPATTAMSISGPDNRIDPTKLIDNFITEYYNTVSNIGWNNIALLYFPDARIMVRDRIIGNHHDFVALLTKKYINRANYGAMSAKWVVVSEDAIMLNVYGTIQVVNFLGVVFDVENFTETFILKQSPDMKLKINVQMLDF